jgi:beta-phosphoglucomutase
VTYRPLDPAPAVPPEPATRRDYAVLWDVDGVIIDSAEQHRQSWHAMAREHGLPFTDEQFWATFGMRNADIIPRVFGVREPERVAAMAERKEVLYRELLARAAAPLPGAPELLAALHRAGYRQALGSSAPEENIRLIVRVLGIGPYLEATVSGETVARGKPAPDIFLAAARAVGVAPAHCLVIEDAPAGVAAAHAGGMRCLAVRRASQPDAPGLHTAEYVAESLRVVDVALVDRLLLG